MRSVASRSGPHCFRLLLRLRGGRSRFSKDSWSSPMTPSKKMPKCQNVTLSARCSGMRGYVRRWTFVNSSPEFGVNLLENRFRNAKQDVFPLLPPKAGDADFQNAVSVTKDATDGVFRKIPKRRYFGDAVMFFESGHTKPH
jgi:hypothetical protein